MLLKLLTIWVLKKWSLIISEFDEIVIHQEGPLSDRFYTNIHPAEETTDHINKTLHRFSGTIHHSDDYD